MSDHVTTRLRLTGFDPVGSELINNFPTQVNALADQIDASVTGWSSDVIARRPTVGTAGRVFLARDDTTSGPNGTLYFDNGTAWVIVPSNNYGAGPLASRPRTTIRGQYYYATDDTTVGANGTLYVNDGTGWVQVQTGPVRLTVLTASATADTDVKSLVAITGTSLRFTLPIDSVLLVRAVFDFALVPSSSDDPVQRGYIRVDGENTATSGRKYAVLEFKGQAGQTNTIRATVYQENVVSLRAGTHTIDLMSTANGSWFGTMTAKSPNTSWTALVLAA